VQVTVHHKIGAGHRDQCAGSFEIRPRLTTGLHQSPEITTEVLLDEVVSLPLMELKTAFVNVVNLKHHCNVQHCTSTERWAVGVGADVELSRL